MILFYGTRCYPSSLDWRSCWGFSHPEIIVEICLPYSNVTKFHCKVFRRSPAFHWKSLFINVCMFRVASGPRISGNLEKSVNFAALEECQGISWNSEKSGNFKWEIEKSQGILLPRNEYRRSFFKIHSSGEQELVMPVHI